MIVNIKKSHYKKINQKTQKYINKLLLPQPLSVLTRLGITPGAPNAKGYLKIRCPFHKNGNERHPSLDLHQTDGHFRCHACGVTGGSILAFFMKHTGKSIQQALKELVVKGVK
jgi:hypothetical protein